jgi:hypothetical protein
MMTLLVEEESERTEKGTKKGKDEKLDDTGPSSQKFRARQSNFYMSTQLMSPPCRPTGPSGGPSGWVRTLTSLKKCGRFYAKLIAKCGRF